MKFRDSTVAHTVRHDSFIDTFLERTKAQSKPSSFSSSGRYVEGDGCAGAAMVAPTRKTSRRSSELFFRRTVRCVPVSALRGDDEGADSSGCGSEAAADSSSAVAGLVGKGVSEARPSCTDSESCTSSEAARNWMPRRRERVGVVCAVEAASKAAISQERVMVVLSCAVV